MEQMVLDLGLTGYVETPVSEEFTEVGTVTVVDYDALEQAQIALQNGEPLTWEMLTDIFGDAVDDLTDGSDSE